MFGLGPSTGDHSSNYFVVSHCLLQKLLTTGVNYSEGHSDFILSFGCCGCVSKGAGDGIETCIKLPAETGIFSSQHHVETGLGPYPAPLTQ